MRVCVCARQPSDVHAVRLPVRDVHVVRQVRRLVQFKVARVGWPCDSKLPLVAVISQSRST